MVTDRLLVDVAGVTTFERGNSGWERSTGTPSECIERAYRAHGGRLSLDLDGEYAFVVRDGTRLTAGCDFHGKQTLFFVVSDGNITISSSLNQCRAVRPKAAIDEEYIADFLTFGSHFGRRTPFGGVSRLAPGDMLEWDGRVRVTDLRRQWTPPAAAVGESAPAAALRALLQEAVEAYLPGQGGVGCELSGGLDSSTVFALARSINKETPAFSFVHPAFPRADERRFIDAALGGNSAAWYTIDADKVGAFAAEPDAAPEPAYSQIYSGRTQAFAEATRRAGVATVLTGIGGDSILLGDRPPPLHIADALRRGHWRYAWREAGRWHRQAEIPRSTAYWLGRAGIDPLLRWLRGAAIVEGAPLPEWYNSDWAARCEMRRRSRRALVHDWRGVALSAQLATIRQEAQNIALFYSPQLAVDFHHPLLSLPLFEFMLSLPDGLRVVPECDRLLHRHAIAGLVPDTIRLRRSKGGTDESIFAGLRRSPHWRQRLCDDPVLARRGYVDRERWRRAVTLFTAGVCPSIRLFQATAVLETWFQQLDSTSAGVST